MTSLRREVRKLTFEIGDETYEVPPVDDERGTELADILTRSPEQAARVKTKPTDLFKLALSPDLWDRMRTDGVGWTDMRCAGLAALAHFQVLLTDTNPATAMDRAEAAARGVWEAGMDPKDLAAWMEANSTPPTNRATRRAAARTTPTPASGTGTTKSPAKKAASRSRGSNSPRTAR